VQPDGDEGDVVVGGVGEHAGQQLVAELVEVAAGEVGERGLQPGQAVVEVLVPALHQPVGVEQHHGVPAQGHLRLPARGVRGHPEHPVGALGGEQRHRPVR
jgi:hypothetical protein